MSLQTKETTEKSLKKALEEKPVSVYSVNFARVINNLTENKGIQKRSGDALEKASRSSLSRKVFKWRNAVAVAAILVVGVLHFVFQVSVVRPELSENLKSAEVPPVKIEQLSAPFADNKTSEFEAKKADVLLPEKQAPRLRQRPQLEIAPVKAQPKRKETVETRQERLRRVERILTGV